MEGKVNNSPIVVQVVRFIQIDNNQFKIEVSDTVNKTHILRLRINQPISMSLYSILKLQYDVMPVDKIKKGLAERYYFQI